VSFRFKAFGNIITGLPMYTKHALTINEQIKKLSQRGLLMDEDAFHFLSHISYYRLAGYWWPMQIE
jgi:abortive infection bacteriophage resistance protein